MKEARRSEREGEALGKSAARGKSLRKMTPDEGGRKGEECARGE